MIFPPEIWEHIFSYVDPVVLMNLKKVCKCWKEIIDRVLKENNHWSVKCRMDVPQDVWSLLYRKLYSDKEHVDLHKVQDSELWMAIYRLWRKCKNLFKYNTSIECLKPIPKHRHAEHITCTAVSNDILGIGTSEGYIYFFNISNINGPPVYVADHVDYVRNVTFLENEGGNPIAVSHSINYYINFWDIALQKHLHKMRGHLFCTDYDKCCIVINNSVIMETSCKRVSYNFNMEDFVAIDANSDQISLYTERGHYVILNLEAEEKSYTIKFIEPPRFKINRYYIFKPEILVCITELGLLGLSVQGRKWKMYNIFSVLHGLPTAILVYAHLVVLGLDSGDVLIYYADDLDMIDFSSTKHQRMTLDVLPIISLEIIIHLGKESLIASNSKSVYIIKFI
ncbi:hypothetical protein KM043_018718 [Ampulex compressa]|nr:hypothetical protein KM043_018718 [Ampulex compressa]